MSHLSLTERDLLRLGGLYANHGHAPPGWQTRAAARPYTGWAGFNYDTALEGDDLYRVLVACARRGVQVAGMTPEMLEVFERVDAEIGIAGLRWVLGHINLLDASDIARIQRLGLVVTTHTNRYVYKEGGNSTATDVGTDPVPVPLRSLLGAGVPVSLGTDNVPVSLFGPIEHCVDRMTRDGPMASRATESLSRVEALRAATVGGAYLTFEEGERGSVEGGKVADLAVLSDDPLTCGLDRIAGIRAVATLLGGEVVHTTGELELPPIESPRGTR